MNILIKIFLITAIAGVGGTGLGGLTSLLFKKSSNRLMAFLLNYACGIMIGIVCFDMLEHAVNPLPNIKINILFVIISLIIGFIIVYSIDIIINKKGSSYQNNHLLITGLIMCIVIFLHNFPEGMSIGAFVNLDDNPFNHETLMMALFIGLHNIPEGLAMTLPLISGKMNKFKAILISMITGIPTILGGFIGYLIGDIGAFGLSFALSFSAGAMLAVVFLDLLPSASDLSNTKINAVGILLGLITGLLIIYF